jgi:membrane dipeptidase
LSDTAVLWNKKGTIPMFNNSLVYLLASLLLAVCLNAQAQQDPAQCDTGGEALEQARALLKSTPLIDGHNDLPWVIREEAGGDVLAYDLTRDTELETDIPKLRAGLLGAQFWSVWVPGELPPIDYGKVQLEQIDIARQIISAYPETFELALTADDIERIYKTGKIASLLGMEGGYALYSSLGAMRMFYELGVRYMTLSHNVTLDWVDAALGEQTHGGLTPFGRAMVKEMNRTGMMVDLAHTSPAAMHQALDETRAPVIWSHAAARALVDHPRNVPDDVLKRLPDNGGVVMVTFVPSFLSQEVWDMEETMWETDASLELTSEYRKIWLAYDAEHGVKRATIDQLAAHIEHVRDIAGIDHVGIGSDYWGMLDGPIGLEDVSGFPHLFAALIYRGWSEEDLSKLAGQNLLRVMRQVETVAGRLQIEMPPSNATIEALDN